MGLPGLSSLVLAILSAHVALVAGLLAFLKRVGGFLLRISSSHGGYAAMGGETAYSVAVVPLCRI